MNKQNNPDKDKELPKIPNYTNDGVAVWVNMDKNNNKYLSIKIVGHSTIYAFEHKPTDSKAKQ